MILIAILLGLLEGVTEFLPISSTGHLIVGGHLLGFTGPVASSFEIFIQLGAILAVVWVYRRHLGSVAAGAFRRDPDPDAWRLLRNLAISFAPAGVVGLLFHGFIQEHLFGPLTVAGSLVVGGVAMIVIERARPEGGVDSIMRISWSMAFAVGCAQALALFPGVSRAAATIMGGMVSGLNRKTATEFSFYLAIPTMFAATLYDLLRSWSVLSVDELAPFAVGFVMAFASALLAVRGLLRFISRHDFQAFGWYRIVFGGFVAAYFLL
ncbi:MAG: undecaprenyl-diphosphate phosphatase [Acidobacteriota bacterium]